MIKLKKLKSVHTLLGSYIQYRDKNYNDQGQTFVNEPYNKCILRYKNDNRNGIKVIINTKK